MSSCPIRAARPAAVAAVLLLALLAAGCGSDAPQFAPACPQLSLLRDAGDLTRFSGAPGASHDARSLLLAARIVAVPAKCEDGGAGKVRAMLELTADVRRGPAAQGNAVSVPYFVALMEQGKVISEQDFTLAAKFRTNVDQVRVTGDQVDILLPVTAAKTAAAYHIYVGFRLTPDELAYNRQSAGRQ